MSNINAIKYLVPLRKRSGIKKITLKKNEFVRTKDDTNIYYISEGRALLSKETSKGEHIFPYLYLEDEFIGVNYAISGAMNEWEVISSTKEVEVYKIPKDIFMEYIFKSPIFLEEYLPKANRIMEMGCQGFYIFIHGGAAAYFAFIINAVLERNVIVRKDRYTEFAEILHTSKATLYTITNMFIEEGIIKKNKNTLKVVDRAKLKSYYEDYI